MQSLSPSKQIESQLEKILASTAFRGSRRRRDLLSWSVQRVLAGDQEPAKEHQIGLEVFGKPLSWDPRLDPGVRVEFNRLRQKLREFYDTDGKEDALVIEFPQRGYLPVIRERRAMEVVEDVVVPPAEKYVADVEPPIAEVLAQPVEIQPVRTEPSAANSGSWVRWAVLAAGLIAVAAVIGTGFRFWKSRSPVAPQPPLSAVAVLPFVRPVPDPGYDYLSDGFADELTGKLAGNGDLRVVARTSAFQFKGKNADVREIGRALQVGSVVEGSILRTGKTMRIAVHLDRTADGKQLWSASYDSQMKDMVQVEDQIARSVASALRVKPVTDDASIALDGEAHDEYLRGAYETQKMTPESLNKAIGHLENALRLAPRYARPNAALGLVHLDLVGFAGRGAKQEMEKAKAYFERAIALDPTLAPAHANLAYVNYVLDWDWPMAEAHFQQAIRLGSGADVLNMYGYGLMTRGRFEEASQHFRGAIERDPLNSMIRLNFASVLNEEGRSQDALEQIRFCLERAPNWFPAHLMASYTAIYSHRPQDALAQLEQARKVVPGNPLVASVTAAAYAELGRKQDAEALLRQIETRKPEGPFIRYHFAIIEALRGNADGVFQWLEQSAELHEEQILYIRVEPLLAQYRNDPRMIALERRVGLL